MTESYKITWTTIWGETKEHTEATAEEAREWILKRRHREDIRQGSWRVERQ